MSTPDLDQAIRTIEKLSHYYKALKDIDEVLKTAKQISKNIPAMEKQREVLTSEISELSDQKAKAVQDLEDSLNTFKVSKTEATVKHKEDMRVLRDEFNTEKNKLSQEVEASVTAASKVADNYSSDIARLKEEREQAQSRVDSLNAAADQLKATLEKVA